MLEAHQLSFAYHSKRPIFQNVSLSLQPGEVQGLIAPSGSGKTTLAKVLSNHLPAQKGTIWINQRPLARKQFWPIQLINQHPEQSFNPRWPLRRSLAESFSPDSSLLTRLGIKTSWLNRYPHELSGGELQRFAIARALNPQTAFLIADEITVMLDAISQAQVWQVLLNISKEQELGMLVISHNPQLLARICTRTVNMCDLSCCGN
jgi:peptide/nickel transport system ATP-binding protein